MAQEKPKCSEDSQSDGLHLDECVQPGAVPGDDPAVLVVPAVTTLQPAACTARLVLLPLFAELRGGDEAVDGDRQHQRQEGVQGSQGDEHGLTVMDNFVLFSFNIVNTSIICLTLIKFAEKQNSPVTILQQGIEYWDYGQGK